MPTRKKGENIGQSGQSENPIQKMTKEHDGDAILIRVKKGKHNICAIAAAHHSTKAGDIFTNDIAPEIKNPSTWMFLLEGGGIAPGMYEMEIANELANDNNIPIFNTIIYPDSRSVIDLYAKTEEGGQVGKSTVMAYVVASLARFRGTRDHKELSMVLGITQEEVRHALAHSVLLALSDLNEFREKSQQIDSKLLEISNFVSAQVLQYHLRKHSDKTNVAMYFGSHHAPILDIGAKDIPKEFQLDDEEIKYILDEEEHYAAMLVLSRAFPDVAMKPYVPPSPDESGRRGRFEF